MADLIDVMSKLVDNKGKILIPGIYDSVAAVTEEECKLYDPISFDQVHACLFATLIIHIIVYKFLP